MTGRWRRRKHHTTTDQSIIFLCSRPQVAVSSPKLMPTRRQFVKRAGSEVIAVQLALETDGFTYRKWGGVQTCKPGDWIVQNNGEVYTVDRDTFARTYQEQSPGVFRKVSPVWAERMETAGSVATKEGVTHYPAGAYLVSNDAGGTDVYAVAAGTFEAMYEPM
jgi:hypothetical protein